MKVRLGFVSNSSTSSFLIYGICIDSEELQKRLLAMGVVDEDEDEPNEKLREAGLEVCSPDETYVGLSWSDVGDDETGQQFKDRVAKLVEDHLGPGLKLGTHEEAWYN